MEKEKEKKRETFNGDLTCSKTNTERREGSCNVHWFRSVQVRAIARDERRENISDKLWPSLSSSTRQDRTWYLQLMLQRQHSGAFGKRVTDACVRPWTTPRVAHIRRSRITADFYGTYIRARVRSVRGDQITAGGPATANARLKRIRLITAVRSVWHRSRDCVYVKACVKSVRRYRRRRRQRQRHYRMRARSRESLRIYDGRASRFSSIHRDKSLWHNISAEPLRLPRDCPLPSIHSSVHSRRKATAALAATVWWGGNARNVEGESNDIWMTIRDVRYL